MTSPRRLLAVAIVRALAPVAPMLAALCAWIHALEAARDLLQRRPFAASANIAEALVVASTDRLMERAVSLRASYHVDALAVLFFSGTAYDVARHFDPRGRVCDNGHGVHMCALDLANTLDLGDALDDIDAAAVALLSPDEVAALRDLAAAVVHEMTDALESVEVPFAGALVRLDIAKTLRDLDNARAVQEAA